MGATWIRTVDASGNGQSLFVLELQYRGSNPPDVPGKPPRADGPNEITVYAEDRAGGGAKIIYQPNGCGLTGLVAKDDSALPQYEMQGVNLVITDTGAEGTEYSYHIAGTYNGNSVQTEDPQIHNSGA